jgi:hypothetical protein
MVYNDASSAHPVRRVAFERVEFSRLVLHEECAALLRLADASLLEYRYTGFP